MSKYTVRRLLYTRGDTVACYEAVQAGLERLVELRVFTKQTAPDAAELVRFQSEVRSLAVLDHPSIVRVIDGGLSAGKLYYVTELKSGRPLLDLLREGLTIEPATVIEIGLQLAEALAYMHSKGVLHRGIDVDSVYFDPERKIAYIGQFTLIRNTRVESITAKGIAPLAPWLATPDAILGRAADAQTDVYLTGVLLFRLLTGRAPFAADAFLAANPDSFASLEVPKPSAENPDVIAEMDGVVARALAPLPDKRFRTMNDLIAALRGAQRTQRLGRRKGSPDASRSMDRSMITGVGRSGVLDASLVGAQSPDASSPGRRRGAIALGASGASGASGDATSTSSAGAAGASGISGPSAAAGGGAATASGAAGALASGARRLWMGDRRKLWALAGAAAVLLVAGLVLLRLALH